MAPGHDGWEPALPEEPGAIVEKLNGPGWVENDTSVFVPEEDAFGYALERVSQGTAQEQWEFVEWFYSGNWIKEE